jgi:short subunit fatty acids transporter
MIAQATTLNVIPLRPTIFDSVKNLMVGGIRGVVLNLDRMIKYNSQKFGSIQRKSL